MCECVYVIIAMFVYLFFFIEQFNIYINKIIILKKLNIEVVVVVVIVELTFVVKLFLMNEFFT